MYSSKPKPSHHLVLTSVLSGSFTILFSIVYIGLTILGLIFRFNCDAFSIASVTPSNMFMDTTYRTYILRSDNCDTAYTVPEITSDYSVFVLNAITLSSCVVNVIAALVLISVLTSESEMKFFKIIIFTYVGVIACSIIVDITFASHFGLDYTYLSNKLNSNNFTIQTEHQRLGAMLLMTVSLKGFIGHFVNIILLVLLVVYAIEYMKQQDNAEHSIHKLGVVKAFDFPKKNEYNSNTCEVCRNTNKGGGSQLNYGYLQDDERPRSPRNLPSSSPRQEYLNSSGFNRSNSWQTAPSSARPFSYLEDVKRPAPARPPPSPSNDSTTWSREPWQPAMPPVPDPDYSPHGPRRLKSALKSYM